MNIFSGGKKFLVSLAGVAALAVSAFAPQYAAFGGFIAATVVAYLLAETSLDKARIARDALSTLIYNAQRFETPSAQPAVSPVTRADVNAEKWDDSDPFAD